MNGEEFEKTIHALHEKLLQLTATKGAEYTQGRDNRFDNFERQAEALGLTREQVLLVFLNKHLDSITTYVKDRALARGREYSEPMTGRVDDAILYLLLLRGMMAQNEAGYFAGAFRGMEELMRPGPDVELSPLACEHNFSEGPNFGHVSLNVGGVTTAARTVEVELRSAEVLDPLAGTHGSRAVYEAEGFKFEGKHAVISAHHPAAVKACQSLGLPPSVSALSAPDQLFKFGRGDTVTFVDVGSPDCKRLYGEVAQRSQDQGFTLAEMTG